MAMFMLVEQNTFKEHTHEDTIVTALEFVILVDVPRMARRQRTRALPNRKKL